MTYGVYDTKDNCWMGNDKGPLLYEDELMARAAATIINEQFGTSHRYRKKDFNERADKLKDVVEAKHTAEEAIKRIERRIT